MGWNLYEKGPGEINYKIWDNEIEWLREKGLKIRAGHLVWNLYTPAWVPNDCDGLVKAVEKRVRNFITYYQGKVDYVNVVNEPSQPFREIMLKDKMTKCYRELGKTQFVSKPFKIARAVNSILKDFWVIMKLLLLRTIPPKNIKLNLKKMVIAISN